MSDASHPNRDGDVRPCVFKACAGQMVFHSSVQLPGTGHVGKMCDGTIRTVGTGRAAWICDRQPTHIQTGGVSRSEVSPSRM